MASTVMTLIDVEASDLEDHFDPQTLTRGASYARAKRVLSPRWLEDSDRDAHLLTASVVGHGALYRTTATFDGALTFVEGECTCPVGYNCKHVAALVFNAAAGQATPPRTRTAPRRPALRPASLVPAPAIATGAWEDPLRALASARRRPPTGDPLAIELRLVAANLGDHGTPRLMARLMRPGARGGWINGSLDWGGVDYLHTRDGGYRDDHVALLRELRAACRPRDPYSGYAYGYRSERAMDLSACESPQLWALLAEATRRGLPLLHERAALGEVPPPVAGEVVLDVTRQSSHAFGVAAVLRLDGCPADHLRPVRCVGRSGHGVVCAHRSDVDDGHSLDRWRLRLVELDRPAAPELQRMLLADERLTIPQDDIERFAQQLCPALRHIAPVVSSDGSFTAPAVSGPALVLHAQHGPGTLLRLGWEWAYDVGDTRHQAPLGAEDDPSSVRDYDAERERWQRTTLDAPALRALGLLDDAGRPTTGPPTTATGLDSLRLTTEVLPQVGAHPEIELQVRGEPPDYRDVGDSLAVSVSTAEVAGERDWFDLGVTITVAGRELAFVAVFSALARGESRMILEDGAHFSLDDPRLQSLRVLIEESRALVETPAGASARVNRYQIDAWAQLRALGVVGEQAQRWQRAVAPLLDLDALPRHAPPRGLRARLRPYQEEGFRWLATLWDLELGGILADDMGLGKTLQALALICHVYERAPELGPFLVVAPTSVAPNWATEAARFAPDLRVDVVLDTLRKSGRSMEEIAAADIVVTTYTLMRLDADAYGSVPWAGLILDEAQFVKNHRGKTYRCARELNVPFTLAITGTPMENNLMELWAMLSLSAPGLFPDPQRFAEHYARPIERRSPAAAERLGRLRRRITPLVKRRTKELVATELPPKQEQTLEIELHPRHRKLYETHLQRERQRVLHLLEDFEHNRIAILRSITRLRQMSLHPGLVEDRYDAVPCAKLDALVEQLDDVTASGHRALVFSQYTTFLARVRARLDAEGIGHCYLDGRTRRRDGVLERFRSGEDPVFLISLKAGGVGLNLVEADYCFLLDPWWNPAVEAQAIDRTHRIGQTRQVMVYRMISHNTIEEKVRALAERKAQLFGSVVDDGDLFSGAITAQDIRGLVG